MVDTVAKPLIPYKRVWMTACIANNNNHNNQLPSQMINQRQHLSNLIYVNKIVHKKIYFLKKKKQ